MKKTKYTQEDFKWVNWTSKQIQKLADEAIAERKENYKKVKAILPEERTYENTVWALTQAGGEHADTLKKMGLLVDVSTKKEVRDTIHEVMMGLTDKVVELEYDRELYTSLVEYREGNFADEKKSLRKEDIKLMDEMIRDYRRMGFDLPEPTQKKLKTLLKKSSKLGDTFRKNINDYQDFILCSKEELDGVAERVITTLPIDEKTNKYKVTLAHPHSMPFMAEANNREKRKELAEKNLQKGGKKNLKIIEDLVVLRAEVAKILGYKHHADLRTEDRMAKNAENVYKFQNELLTKLIKPAKKDIDELKVHAKTLGIKKLEHYDIGYVATSLKKKLFDLDPETVRAYFPVEHVINEMFNLCGNLFGVTFNKTELKTWIKDAVTYEVLDKNSKSLLGYITFDLFAREGKFAGTACCSDVIVAREKSFNSEEFITPFTSILCNFPTPSKKIPTLLSVYEVEVLFHEFGHSLHMTLSSSRHESQGGSNVAWDFVETPSQIMENWVYNEEVLKKLSKHYQTGKSLPKEMIANIILGNKFQKGYMFMRQIIQGKLDFDLHTGKIKDASKAYRQFMKKYLLIDLPEKETLFPAGFGHLVGYDAGYYSYLWALVYASDAFSEFEKKGIFNKEVGMKWRKEVLEKGSSEDEMKLIKNFLGRAPNQKAFLKELGI